MIKLEDFQKLDLRVGKIIEAEKISNTDKLLRIEVDLGSEWRQIVAGIGKVYQPQELKGKEIVVVCNLEPKVIKGVESQGMLLAVLDSEANPVLIVPEREVPEGSKVS